MTRAELREFVREGVEDMVPPLEFNEGQISDFAANRSHNYPVALLLLDSTDTKITDSAPIDTWKVILYVADLDKMDSLPIVYEDMVDRCDDIARRLIYKYRNIISGYKLVTMESVLRERLIKTPILSPDCLTGVMLTFDVIAPDQDDVC